LSGKKSSKENLADLVAPLSLRFGAMLIDYVAMIFPPVVALAIGRLGGLDGTRLLGSWIIDIGWFVSVVFFLLNFILLPVLTGQTIGKRLVGLRIVDTEGRIPSLRAVALRNMLGYFLNILSFGLAFVPAFGRSGRGTHDRISRTIVIHASVS
jgi:uncharacterized RDD family membrane protein YckC